jgi:hypothetical protein
MRVFYSQQNDLTPTKFYMNLINFRDIALSFVASK